MFAVVLAAINEKREVPSIIAITWAIAIFLLFTSAPLAIAQEVSDATTTSW